MSDAFDEWVKLLADQYAAEVQKEGEWYRIRSSSEEWAKLVDTEESVALTLSPDSEASWKNRLLLVEKAVARAIGTAPVGFSCELADRGAGPNTETSDVTVVRLAYGFSLSVGRCLRQRFTAYYVIELDKSFHVLGRDGFFDLAHHVQELDLESQVVESGLLPLLATVQETQQVYCSLDSVRSELSRLQKSLSRQLRDLDRLYTINYGQYARLCGRVPTGLRGEDAIEAEYMNKMEDIFHRHQPAIVFEPLTLGVIYCKVNIKRHRRIPEIEFPFNSDQLFR